MPQTAQPRGFRHSKNPRRPSRARLRLNLNLSSELSDSLLGSLKGLPELTGSPIQICFQSQLTAHRGKLLLRQPCRGIAIYAASFIRKREIVLESELLNRPRMLRFIVVHELFHFVWVRLGNRAREQFGELLAEECAHRARGELGESAAIKKSLLGVRDCLARSRQWRDYVCESFCDTAAWLYSGAKSDAFTLAMGWRKRRARWFKANFETCLKC